MAGHDGGVPVILAAQEAQMGGLWSRLSWAKARPYLTNNPRKEGWGRVQVVEGLPSKCKALNLNPSSAKKKVILPL
jgi:hypothetical protein